jgi:hypothetical protein
MTAYVTIILFILFSKLQITCKDFKDDDDQGVDSAPLLYHSLLSYPSPLPKKLIGLIVEQVSHFDFLG